MRPQCTEVIVNHCIKANEDTTKNVIETTAEAIQTTEFIETTTIPEIEVKSKLSQNSAAGNLIHSRK